MSCETLNQGSTGLQVSMASLPEGFCPTSMQELANAIAERLIVSPNQAFTSFATGGVAPSSNVGPWFKDCLDLFVFDDATATYVPIQIIGDLNTPTVFDSSNTFVVPDFITRIKVEAWGGGGGGGTVVTAEGGGGGGSGGYGMAILAVTPAQAITVTVGTGGAGGSPGANGNDSNVLTLTAGGGFGGANGDGDGGNGGAGGIVTGATISVLGNPGSDSDGILGQALGGDGGTPGGGGGGPGKAGATQAHANGIVPAAGGAGATNAKNTPGNGANGRVIIWY